MHTFHDFKGFADAEVELFKPVTLLIGKNGSGKTNVIEGVELLANLAHGRPLYEIADVGRGATGFEIRGGLQGCPRVGKKAFSLGFRGSLLWEGERELFFYEIQIGVSPEPKISNESLTIGRRTLFRAGAEEGSRAILRVQYDNFAKGGNKPSTTLTADRSVLSQYEELTARLKNPTKAKAAIDVANAIRNYLDASFVFDPHPRTMRGYERIGQRVLARDGANLSAVLYALSEGSPEERATLARIRDKIQQLPEEPFADFGFVTTQQHDVLFGFRQKAKGPLVDARVLSDGTLRALAVLTALETVATGSRIVIEEFDNGLHPSRVGVVTQAIWECSKRRRLNVLVTTHNPATLDSLEADQLDGVVLCHRDPRQGASLLTPLLEIPRADTLLERGQLGDLVTRRVVEQHLLPDFEEATQRKAKEWLATLA